MTAPQKGLVALIGAYERDNFGDLLFLLQTEAYLADHGLETLATSAFEADMTPLLGRRIPAFHRILERQAVDHIWTVGGEVGGATMATAIAALGARHGLHAGRAAAIRTLSGASPQAPAYLARPTAFPRNALASLTLNSVGLAGLSGVPVEDRLVHLAALREADSVIVRDTSSADLLAREGVAHRLAPDLIHTLALTRPQPRRHSDIVLVQASERWIRAVGPQSLARALVSAPDLKTARIRLFLAGTAPGHDSVDAFAAVARHVRALAPATDIELDGSSRDPWQLVNRISEARLWIGQSLHGRIVSAAYGVPRLSLADPKLDAYAATWDEGMPAGVIPTTLGSAVERALSREAARGDEGVGRRLGTLADASMRESIAVMLARTPADRFASRIAGVEDLRRRQVAVLEAAVTRKLSRGLRTAVRRSTGHARRQARMAALRVRSAMPHEGER
ncbi:polysaccharide pyruvyl transferase family protein [Actinotalea solisilvae]|uniref:polysaccharide pyruvyl transferase family protein n=1 Tax=Actinotalea solisilvae TaxID=2072922 RepID=UPI0018F16240|nr:polysaccharide pyruvyl transferase family protein [Actinotalea solisilvae]